MQLRILVQRYDFANLTSKRSIVVDSDIYCLLLSETGLRNPDRDHVHFLAGGNAALRICTGRAPNFVIGCVFGQVE